MAVRGETEPSVFLWDDHSQELVQKIPTYGISVSEGYRSILIAYDTTNLLLFHEVPKLGWEISIS
jgi:hypothetical protein